MTLQSLQREYDRALPKEKEVTDTMIVARAKLLMEKGQKCYPFSPDNFVEAINEVDVQHACRSMSIGCHTIAGMTLADAVTRYWEKQAEVRAENELWEEEK